MDNLIKFNKETLTALPIPERGKRAVYRDSKTSGLQIRVSSTGAKTFCVYRRVKGGSPERITLGAFPEMTYEAAKRHASRINAEIEEGGNPAKVKRAHRDEMTFAELFKEYGERHGEKKRSWITDQSNYANHLQPLAPLKVTTIRRESISRLMSNMEKAGLAGATQNNVRALVSSIYGRAIEWGYVTTNPVIGVKTRPKVKRDRFLQSDELPRFFQAVADEPNEAMRDFILLSLLTGARRANVLAMRWDEVNIDDGLWRIPVTKNGTPQNVTLSPEAVQVLLARRDANSKNHTGFVFPGVGASGHMEEPKKGVIRIMERAGIPYGRNVENGVTLHDLRRTLGSWQAKTGASLAIIGKSLNHKSQQATMIYARLDLDPVRQSVNTATTAMMEAAGLKPVAEVVPLKKRSA
jgi:integrase